MTLIGNIFKQAALVIGMTIAANSYGQNGQTEAPKSIPVKPQLSDSQIAERDVIRRMSDAGYSDFILLNKKNSNLYVIQNSRYMLETPVVIGRGEGQKNLTPSGAFSLRNEFQGEAKQLMVFHVDPRVAYLLHGVVPGREGALRIDSTNARQLSDGCINVPDAILPYVLGWARQKAAHNPNGTATPFIVMDEKYSPVKFDKTLQNFKPDPYNPNIY